MTLKNRNAAEAKDRGDSHEEIFAAARRLPEPEREQYLENACRSEAERVLVAELLAKSSRADAFLDDLDGSPPGHAEPSPVAEKLGDTIGSYKLLQEIGEGGFGVVFLAQQSRPILRRVALKIIKAGMDTRQVIARFEAERQALAMMDHPNIARVLEAGATDTGRPYFAMELVRGEPITEFCDRQALDPRQRLELFLTVCAAVNHAHQKGIIHRDLKPSNILVGIDGNTPIVKVIDFGVAKALQQQLTEKTLFTRYEQFLGTPLYVSPEQANLSPIDVDTRSDIYSLGVILYELLAGKPPVDAEELHSAGFDEMRRLIREKEALKPSTRFNTASEEERNTIARNRNTEPHRLSLRVKGDLDWIVLKALEKDRGRRYETANAFAEDIRRHLADEPVTAAAPSRVYRFRKLLRRNRTAFGAAAVVLIALLAGLAVSTWSFLNEKEARRKEEQTRLHAEESERQTRLVASFLQDLLEGINPEFIQGMNLDVLRSRLDRIGTQMEGELPQDSPAAVELLLTLGKVYNALGKSDDARPILEKSLRGARMLDDQPKIVEALVALADAIEGEADPDYNEECSLLNEGMELSREIHGTSHPTSILLLSRLGALKSNKFRDPVGVTQAEEAWRLADQHLAENDPIRASAFGNLYRSKQRQITVEERHTMLAELKSVIESSRGQNHLYWPRAVSDLAFSHLKMEEIEPDRGHLQSALQLAKMADLRSRSILPAGHGEQIDRLWRLAGIQLAAGQLDEARASWEEALKYQRARWGAGIPESSDSRWPRKKLVSMLREAGEDEFADQLQHWEHWDQLPTKN